MSRRGSRDRGEGRVPDCSKNSVLRNLQQTVSQLPQARVHRCSQAPVCPGSKGLLPNAEQTVLLRGPFTKLSAEGKTRVLSCSKDSDQGNLRSPMLHSPEKCLSTNLRAGLQ